MLKAFSALLVDEFDPLPTFLYTTQKFSMLDAKSTISIHRILVVEMILHFLEKKVNPFHVYFLKIFLIYLGII